MRTLIALLILSTYASCQTLEDGWKGIRPLETSRTQVEKILGTKPRNDQDIYPIYATPDAVVEVIYSTGPCVEEKYDRGRYNVPAETVISYRVSFLRRELLLNDLHFKKDEYSRDDSGDTDSILYVSDKYGLIVTSQFQEKIEYAGGLDFRPGKKIADKKSCK